MPIENRIFRVLLPSLLLLFLSAAGCSSLDSGSPWNSSRWSGGGTTTGSAIDVSAGGGTVGEGGYGDQDYGIWLDNYGPLGVKIYRTGTADASFTLDVPAATPDFGVEPLMVTTDMTIPVYDADPVDNNVYYFRTDDTSLYHKIDDSNINYVTGIQVGAGAALTLPINSDLDYSGYNETAALYLENDLEVLGTLRTAAFEDDATQDSGDPNDRGALAFETYGGVFIRSAGVVSTAGDNTATGRGGHGGAIDLYSYADGATNGGIIVNEGLIDASGGSTDDLDAEGGGSAAFSGYGNGLNLYADTGFVNTGTIRADGGTGGTGGQAGGWYGNSFYVGGQGTLQNTGSISVSGGTGTNGGGGAGGQLDMEAGEVSLHNSGAITTRGGSGTVGGGMGGNVNMYVSYIGDLLTSGAIDASGGDSTGTDNSLSTSGGQGASISLYCYGGKLISSGPIEAGGGDVANANSGSYGGSGGYVDIESYPDYWGGASPAGAMEISGNIFARGGAGPNGAYGGAVYMDYADSTGTGGIVLRGYSNLINNGGRGVTYGGDGGGVYLYDYYSGGVAGSGGLLTEADISANGGNATDSGGYGGYVEIYSYAPPSQYRAATADGGTGTTPGGTGTITIDGGGPV